jgi:hypothetical protein
MATPHKVAIVADRDFASRLDALSRSVHVWVCDSPSNKQAATRIWAAREDYDLESGVTTFNALPTDSGEDMVIGVLPALDLHHNEYSHDPPWSIIDVYGTTLTPKLEAALREFGVTEFELWDGGFTCRRASSVAA